LSSWSVVVPRSSWFRFRAKIEHSSVAHRFTNSDPCPPLALISPGAGGSENGYRYLAEGLQTDGWRAIVMGHQESGAALRSDIRDTHSIKGGLRELVDDPKAYDARLLDIQAALKWAEQSCKSPYIALIGHSMGARTVMIEAGAKNKIGVKGQDRFKAYVAMSRMDLILYFRKMPGAAFINQC